MTKYHILI